MTRWPPAHRSIRLCTGSARPRSSCVMLSGWGSTTHPRSAIHVSALDDLEAIWIIAGIFVRSRRRECIPNSGFTEARQSRLDIFNRGGECHDRRKKAQKEGLKSCSKRRSLGARALSRGWRSLVIRQRRGTLPHQPDPVRDPEKSIVEAEAIDLFLHACVARLFDMDWMLVCPMCSDVVESFRKPAQNAHAFPLQPLPKRLRCRARRLRPVTFTVSPAVRGIRFHEIRLPCQGLGLHLLLQGRRQAVCCLTACRGCKR